METGGTDTPAHLDLIKANTCFFLQSSLEIVKSLGSAEWSRKVGRRVGGSLSSLVRPTSNGVSFKPFPA